MAPLPIPLIRNEYFSSQANQSQKYPFPPIQYVTNVSDLKNPKHKFLYRMPSDVYIAAQRVDKITEELTLDAAAQFVAALPFRLQSTVVWNHLIAACAKSGRGNLAEHYYVQMRKRGLSPNGRTFTSIITALVKSTSPEAIKRAENWFKRMADFNIEPNAFQMNALLRNYAHAGEKDRMMDRFYYLKSTITPDKATYSIILRYYPDEMDTRLLREMWKEILDRLEPNVATPAPPKSSLAEKATKIIEKEPQLQTAIQRDTMHIDDTLVSSILFALAKSGTRERDVALGIEIVSVLFGICPPAAQQILARQNISEPIQRYNVKMTTKTLDSILRCFSTLDRNTLAKQYFKAAFKHYPDLESDGYLANTYDYVSRQTRRHFSKQNA